MKQMGKDKPSNELKTLVKRSPVVKRKCGKGKNYSTLNCILLTDAWFSGKPTGID